MSLDHSVRRARPSDAEGIARVNVASWRAAYEGLLPDEVLADLVETDTTATWRDRIERGEPPGSRLILIELHGELVGYAYVGPSRDQDSILEDATGEIYGFYIHPDHWGEGLGRFLMKAALNELRARGDVSVTLNVVEGNERARVFYERLGFAIDKEAAPWFEAPQLRYRKDL